MFYLKNIYKNRNCQFILYSTVLLSTFVLIIQFLFVATTVLWRQRIQYNILSASFFCPKNELRIRMGGETRPRSCKYGEKEVQKADQLFFR